METTWLWRRKLKHALQSLLLIAVMALLVGVLGWLLAGPAGLILPVVALIMSLLLSPALSPGLILRLINARPLPGDAALYRTVGTLAERAGLPTVPMLYYIANPMLNAFTLGNSRNAAIAVTDGLLRALDARELQAVLAHEISHIRNNDIWIMGLAELFSRITAVFSLTGQLLLLINLPLLLLTDMTINWLTILLLLFAPGFSVLIQLALSRLREYDADMEGAALCGDPLALASALDKIERSQGGMFERLFWPRRSEPSMLRTHPRTAERIRRLRAMARNNNPALQSGRSWI